MNSKRRLLTILDTYKLVTFLLSEDKPRWFEVTPGVKPETFIVTINADENWPRGCGVRPIEEWREPKK